jgi:hypothetical protein
LNCAPAAKTNGGADEIQVAATFDPMAVYDSTGAAGHDAAAVAPATLATAWKTDMIGLSPSTAKTR